MITLRAVGCTTAEYVGSPGTAEATSSTAIEERDKVVDEEDQPFGDDSNTDECEKVSADVDGPSSDELPLLFFFDCESTGRSMYTDHMIEVGEKVVAVPNSVSITQRQYGSLIHSSPSIAQAAQMLVAEPPFRHVLEELLA